MKKALILFTVFFAAVCAHADPLILGNGCVTQDNNGIFAINDTLKRLSYRFTVPYDMTVSQIRIYSPYKSGSPVYEIGIQSDSGGYPSGVYVGGYQTNATFISGAWQAVSISPTNIFKGQVYHIVIRATTASGTVYNNFIYSTPAHGIFPKTQAFDYRAQVLTYNGTWSPANFGEGGMPIFMLYDSGAAHFGNPYCAPSIYAIHAGGTPGDISNDSVAGEQFVWNNPDTSIKGIEFYVRRFGNPAEPLKYRIYNMTDNVTITADVLANSFNVSTGFSWKRAYFTPLNLVNGKTYRVFLYADSDSASLNQFETVVNGINTTDTFYTDSGYGGTQSSFITDSNGGQSFTVYTDSDLLFRLVKGDALCTEGMFGKNFTGYSTPWTSDGDSLNSSKYMMPVTGTVNSVSINIAAITQGNTGVRVAVYQNNPTLNAGNGGPENLITQSALYNVAPGWNDIPVTQATLYPGMYWLAFQAQAGVEIDNNYSVGSLGEAYVNPYAFGNFPGTFNATNYDDTQWSVYANFCEGGAAPTPTPTPCAGARDSTFGTNGTKRFGESLYYDNAAAVAFDKKNERYILVGSSFNGSNQDMMVWCVKPDGTLDTSFNYPNGFYRFNGKDNMQDMATAVTLDDRGRILVAGISENIASGGNLCAWRFTPNGRPDITFNGRGYFTYTGPGMMWDEARGIAVTPLGEIIVAGTMNTGSENEMTVLRLKRDGTYDSHNSHSSGFVNSRGHAVKVNLSGDIFVAGAGFNGSYDNAVIWKLNPDLSVNGIFNSGSGYNYHNAFNNSVFNAVDIDVSGNIYCAGSFYNGSNNDVLVIRYLPSGSADASFNSGFGSISVGGLTGWGGNDIATGILVDSGKFTISGTTDNALDSDAFAARFLVNGTADESFGSGGIRVYDALDGYAGSDNGTGIAMDNYKRIIISAECQNGNFNSDASILRLKDECTGFVPSPTPVLNLTPCAVNPDISFAGGTAVAGGTDFDSAFCSAVQKDGKVLAAGQTYNTMYFNYDMAVWRFNQDGSPDNTFNNASGMLSINNTAGGNGMDTANGIAIDSLGRIVVCGTSQGTDFTSEAVVWRLTKDGRLDYSFNGKGYIVLPGGGGQDFANSVCFDGAGNIYAAGSVELTGNLDMTVWKIKPNGTLDDTFAFSGRFNSGYAGMDRAENIFRHSSGNIVIAGSISDGGNDDISLWMMTPSGSLYSGFNGTGNVRYYTPEINDNARSACEGQGGIIYAAGTAFGTVTDGIIVSFAQDGTVNQNFAGGAVLVHNLSGISTGDNLNGVCYYDNKLYAAGTTRDNMSYDMGAVIRFNDDGTTDPYFGPAGAFLYDYGTGSETFNSISIDPYGRVVTAGSVDTGNQQAAAVRLSDNCLSVTPSPTPTVSVTPCNVTFHFPFNSSGKVSLNNAAGGNGFDDAMSIVFDGESVILGGNSMGLSSNVDCVLVKYKPDGGLDQTFGSYGITALVNPAGENGNDNIGAIIRDDKGRIIVTGMGTGPGYNEDMFVARFTASGRRDYSFNGGYAVYSGANMDRGEDAAIDLAGKIVIAGMATDGAESRACVWRYNPDGTPDYSFGGGLGRIILYQQAMGMSAAMDVETDALGNYIIAGRVPGGSWDDISVWKVKPDGNYDTSFGGTGHIQYYMESGQFPSCMRVGADGKIYITGGLYNGTDNDMLLIRLNGNGSIDETFEGGIITRHNIAGGNGNDNGNALFLSENRVIVTGNSMSSLGDEVPYLLRFNYDGSADTGFAPGGIMTFENLFGYSGWSSFNDVAIDGWGRIVAAGSAQTANGPDMGIVKLSDYCSLIVPTATPTVSVTPCLYINEPYFNAGTIRLSSHTSSDRANAVLRSSDGSLFVAGEEYSSVSGNYDAVIWKIKANGQPDDEFGIDGKASFNSILGGNGLDRFNAIVEAPDKSIYLAGESYNMNYVENYFVLKLNRYGMVDTSYGSSGRYTHNSIFEMERARGLALDASGLIYIACMERSGGMDSFTIRKLLSTGVEDNTFGTGGVIQYTGGTGNEATGIIYDQATASLYACGRISMGSRVIKFSQSGNPDNAWGAAGIKDIYYSGINLNLNSIAKDSSGRIICAGNIWDGGTNDALVLRLDSIGNLDPSFNGGIVTFANMAGGTTQYAQSVYCVNDSAYIAGTAINAVSRSQGFIIKLDDKGDPDPAFNNNGMYMLSELRGAGSDVYMNAVIADNFGRVNFAGSSWNGTDEKMFAGSIISACNPAPTPTNTPLPCVDKDISFSPSGIRVFDSTFGYDTGYDLTTDRNGKILVCGAMTNSMGGQDMAVIRYNNDGTIDTSFGINGIASYNGAADGPDAAYNVIALPDGKILVCGETDWDATAAVNYDMIAWRLNEDGTPDNTLSGNGRIEYGRGYGQDCAYGISVDSMGRIIISGYSEGGATGQDGIIRRYLPDGSSDMSFNGSGQFIFDISGQEKFMNTVILPDNSIVTAGEAFNGFGSMILVKLKPDGTTDTGFAPGGYIFDGNIIDACGASAIRLDSQGRFVVAGRSYSSGNGNVKIWRYTPVGAPDGLFAGSGNKIIEMGGTNDFAMGLWIDRNDRILVSGSSGNGSIDTKGFVARINENGSLDDNFGNGFRLMFDSMAGGTGGIDEIISVISDETNRILFTGGSANDSAFMDPQNRDMILARGIDSCSVFNTPTYTQTPTATATATHTATQGALSNESIVQVAQALTLDAPNKKVSMRFSVQGSKVLQKVSVNSYIYGTSPVYKIGIQGDDGSGKPNGAYIGPVINSLLNAGWMEISGLSAGLSSGTPYHIVIEYSSGTVDAGNCAMVYYASNPNHKIMPKGQIYDNFASVAYDAGAGWVVTDNMPVFLAGFDTGGGYGNPYSFNNGDNVYGGNESAQLFRGPSVSTTVNKIGCYIARFGAAPSDNLYFGLYNVTDSVSLGTGILWTPAMSSTARQWVEAYLPADVTLEPGKMYRLALASPLSDASNRYVFIRMSSDSIPYADLSYDGTLSYAQYSNDGGFNWNNWTDSDFGFRIINDPVTPTYTYTITPTVSQTATQSITQTVTSTVTQTVTASITSTATETITVTATESITATVTGTVSPTVTASITGTVTATITGTVSQTITQTQTESATPTLTATQTQTQSITPSSTPSITGTVTNTITGTVTQTSTGTISATVTQTVTGTITNTVTQTISGTATGTVTATVTGTVTGTATQSVTPTVTPTNTSADTATQTITQTATQTVTETASKTVTMTATPSITPSVTATVTETSSNTETPTETHTNTETPTFTHTYTQTYTNTPSNTATDTGTATYTHTDTNTPTFTNTFTSTHTFTQTNTFTPSHTFTITPTFTNSPTPNIAQSTDKNVVDISKGDDLKVKILAVAAGEKVKVKVYNLTGDKVAEFDTNTQAAGWNEIIWDCKNKAGKIVGRGMYFLYIEHNGTKTVKRVYIIK